MIDYLVIVALRETAKLKQIHLANLENFPATEAIYRVISAPRIGAPAMKHFWRIQNATKSEWTGLRHGCNIGMDLCRSDISFSAGLGQHICIFIRKIDIDTTTNWEAKKRTTFYHCIVIIMKIGR